MMFSPTINITARLPLLFNFATTENLNILIGVWSTLLSKNYS